MTVIENYLKEIENLINKIPSKLSTKLEFENRGDIVLFLRGVVIFTDKSELHFKEYIFLIPELKKLAYSYHYQDVNKELIFRYDNAEHHPDIETYPSHKHQDDVVVPSKELSLEQILNKILTMLLKK